MPQDNEMVDIVDKNCKIIGTSLKREAHKKGLLHATVIAAVINKRGDWLLVTQSKNRQEPGKYVCPMGGHVAHGETFEDALKREMKEELGVDDFKYRLKGKFIYNVFVCNRQENHYFIVYEVYSDTKPCLSHEASGYKYFSVKELKSEITHHKELYGNSFLAVLDHLYPSL